MQAQPYYCENCNSGFNTETLPPQTVHYEELMHKIQHIYKDYVAPFVLEPADTTVIIPKERIMKAVAGTATSFGRIRHAEQNVDIVRQMVAADLLDLDLDTGVPPAGVPAADSQESPLTFVELGAGVNLCDRLEVLLLYRLFNDCS
jgi:hypothetical protein